MEILHAPHNGRTNPTSHASHKERSGARGPNTRRRSSCHRAETKVSPLIEGLGPPVERTAGDVRTGPAFDLRACSPNPEAIPPDRHKDRDPHRTYLEPLRSNGRSA